MNGRAFGLYSDHILVRDRSEVENDDLVQAVEWL